MPTAARPPGNGDEVAPAVAAALAEALPEEPGPEQRLSLADLAERSGASLPLLEAAARQGLLVPTGDAYAPSDVDAVRAAMSLLEAGVPLSELLALAREHDEATRALAARAVDLFARYVSDPLRANAGDADDVASALVSAVEEMLPVAGTVVAHHFRRRLLAAARARLSPATTPDPR